MNIAKVNKIKREIFNSLSVDEQLLLAQSIIESAESRKLTSTDGAWFEEADYRLKEMLKGKNILSESEFNRRLDNLGKE